VYRILVWKPEGRPKGRWDNNIKMNPQKVDWEGKDWFDLTKVMNNW